MQDGVRSNCVIRHNYFPRLSAIWRPFQPQWMEYMVSLSRNPSWDNKSLCSVWKPQEDCGINRIPCLASRNCQTSLLFRYTCPDPLSCQSCERLLRPTQNRGHMDGLDTGQTTRTHVDTFSHKRDLAYQLAGAVCDTGWQPALDHHAVCNSPTADISNSGRS